MSQRDVGYVIDRLMTDGDLRVQFALDPLLAIAELQTLGLALTSAEMDALMQSDVRRWCDEKTRVPARPH